MATRKPTKLAESADALAEARALVDLPDFGVKAGELLRDDVLVVASLAATGQVDRHPEAVAYAMALQS